MDRDAANAAPLSHSADERDAAATAPQSAASSSRAGLIQGGAGGPLELLRESLRLNSRLRNRRVVALCLEQLACLGGNSGGPADQARLFGAAETLLEQLPDYTLPPQMLQAHEVELLERRMCWVSRPSVTR